MSDLPFRKSAIVIELAMCEVTGAYVGSVLGVWRVVIGWLEGVKRGVASCLEGVPTTTVTDVVWRDSILADMCLYMQMARQVTGGPRAKVQLSKCT